MPKHTYRPISEAPKDGTPIVGVCGGGEMAVAWEPTLGHAKPQTGNAHEVLR